MKFKRLLCFLGNRAVILSLLVLSQLALLIILLWFCRQKAPWLIIVLRYAAILASIYIISKSGNPSYKLSWILLIFLMPEIGIIFYLINSKNSSLDESSNLSPMSNENNIHNVLFDAAHIDPQNNFYQLSKYIYCCTGFLPQSNTDSKFFSSGSHLFNELCSALLSAQKFIFMEYFIVSTGALWDKIEQILTKKAAAGIDIRLIYDDVGSMNTLPRNFAADLVAKGISVCIFNRCLPHLSTAMNYRDHRKICIVDGNIGFCGGANIADEYINMLPRCAHWKDTGIMLHGSGVENLTRLFLSLWSYSTGEKVCEEIFLPTESCIANGIVQAFGDNPLNKLYVSQNVCIMAALRATSYLYITTPYLIPDYEMINALSIAALSGVDVRIITPGVPDKKYIHIVSQSYYKELIKNGIRIFEYSPGFIHSKQLICDDAFAMVGTANIDFRSFYLHFESAVCLYNCASIAEIKRDFERCLICCRQISEKELSGIPLWQRICAVLLRPFAPLF